MAVSGQEVLYSQTDPTCKFLLGHALGNFWWIVLIVQAAFIGFYAILWFGFFNRRGTPVTKCHMFILYFNSSFWVWFIYWFVLKFGCGGNIGNEPIFITAGVFAGIFLLGSCIHNCCGCCCAVGEAGYFATQKTMQEAIKYMADMKETAPVHRVEIECYHYEEDFHRRRHSSGMHNRSSNRNKRITYREWREFIYDRWEDHSDYPDLPAISQEKPVVAIESEVIVAPGDDFTLEQFDNFRRNFVEQNRMRDQYIDETISTIIPGHESKVTAKSEKDGEVPWWLNRCLFHFLAIMLCSCPLRVLFRSRSKKHRFEIRKLYYLEPEGANIGNMGVNVTVNIVDNQGTVNIGTDPNGMPMVQNQAHNNMAQPMGQQQQYPQQYPTLQQQPGYPPAQSGYPAAQPSYPQPQPGYPPATQGYPSAQQSYTPGGQQGQGGYQPVYNPANTQASYNPNIV